MSFTFYNIRTSNQATVQTLLLKCFLKLDCSSKVISAKTKTIEQLRTKCLKCLRKAAKAFIELEGDFELTDLTKKKKKDQTEIII